MFAAECLARGVEVNGADIDVGTTSDPGRIGPGGTFRDVTGAKRTTPIMPRVRAAFEATRAWVLSGRRAPETIIQTIERVEREEPTLIRELVGFDVLIGGKP